jgi:hypothetical protein
VVWFVKSGRVLSLNGAIVDDMTIPNAPQARRRHFNNSSNVRVEPKLKNRKKIRQKLKIPSQILGVGFLAFGLLNYRK